MPRLVDGGHDGRSFDLDTVKHEVNHI